MADTERWQHPLQVAVEAAREAGAILQEWSTRFTISEKSRFNLVTEADVAAEQAISRKLLEHFPEHAFLGEEGLNQAGSTPEFRWIIDPLDGTGNYTHGFPYYCVSIGLEFDGEMAVGVIYDPTRDDLFSAVRGGGAFLNGLPIAVSPAQSLAQSLCVASLPVDSSPTHPSVARFLNVLPHAQSIQRHGSAAMNLAYVACGRIEAFWSASLKPWDKAAGVLLVREAGGLITCMDGAAHHVHQPEILATCTPGVHQELQPLLQVPA